jgi:hypothetical protein
MRLFIAFMTSEEAPTARATSSVATCPLSVLAHDPICATAMCRRFFSLRVLTSSLAIGMIIDLSLVFFAVALMRALHWGREVVRGGGGLKGGGAVSMHLGAGVSGLCARECKNSGTPHAEGDRLCLRRYLVLLPLDGADLRLNAALLFPQLFLPFFGAFLHRLLLAEQPLANSELFAAHGDCSRQHCWDPSASPLKSHATTRWPTAGSDRNACVFVFRPLLNWRGRGEQSVRYMHSSVVLRWVPRGSVAIAISQQLVVGNDVKKGEWGTTEQRNDLRPSTTAPINLWNYNSYRCACSVHFTSKAPQAHETRFSNAS